MRGRRNVIVFSRDWCVASPLRLVLQTRLRITVAETDDPDAVRALWATGEYEGVIVHSGVRDCDLIGNIVGNDQRVILAGKMAMEEMVDRVRMMVTRKRGPKKKCGSVTAEMMAEAVS